MKVKNNKNNKILRIVSISNKHLTYFARLKKTRACGLRRHTPAPIYDNDSHYQFICQ